MLAAVLAVVSISQAALEIKNLAVSPDAAIRWERVEISFDLAGSFKNPFDPREIDVMATVEGPAGTVAEVPGFFASPGWKIAFAPWTAGNFYVSITCTDRIARLDYKKFQIKVAPLPKNSKWPAGFLETKKNKKYLSAGGKGLFVVAREGTLPDRGNALLFQLGGSYPTEGPMGNYRLEQFDGIEKNLASAKEERTYTLLCLGAGRDLAGEGWKENPYNKANGGPCETPEDFWTNLQARVYFKKWLRYLLARTNAHSSMGGVRLWRDKSAPNYWLEEMADEVYALHPYSIPIISPIEGPFQASAKVNTLSLPSGNSVTYKLPLLTIASEVRGLYRALVQGAAGAISPVLVTRSFAERGSARPFSEFAERYDLLKRSFESKPMVTGADCKGWALIDSRGGPVYVEANDAEALAGTAKLAMRSGGDYKITWIDPLTGVKIGEGVAKAAQGALVIAYPAFANGLAGHLEKSN
ncbi:MAG: DUF5060 domain-containing protein [Fimbriimonadales bacterium]